MKQLTEEEAITFYNSEIWKDMDYKELALFQLEQRLLCVPFDVFHEAVEKLLERPVWTHEFGLNREGLINEAKGFAKAPSFEEILQLLPAEKTLLVKT